MNKLTITDYPSPMHNSDIRVAIVHDWLIGGGAEKVVLELHRMFPDAPIYTSYATDEWRSKLDNKVVTGYLQHFGRLRKFMVLPRMWWFSHLDLSGYDLIISSSGNGEAFAVRKNYRPLRSRLKSMGNGNRKMENKPKHSVHINYCHTPTHYYWRHYDKYYKSPGFGIFDPLARLGLKLLVGPLRKWDYKAAQRADHVLANSTHIQSDIKQYYGRESQVLFPPVDTTAFAVINSEEKRGFITHGRLAPMKHVDIIVAAANRLNRPLTVIGLGPMYDKLKQMAQSNVRLLGFVDDAQLKSELAYAEGFVFASYEDFGIAPIEAMAAGLPVVAYKAGGALDYVKPGVTGEFFDEQTPESLEAVLSAFDSGKYNSNDIKAAAESFSIEQFHHRLRKIISELI